MGQQVSRTEFEWVYTEEPHATRRKLILAKYPEIKELMGPDIMLKWKVLLCVIMQLLVSVLVRNYSWPVIIICAYVFGGINHSLTLAIHEISHNLAFGSSHPTKNRFLGIFANLPIFIPMSSSFKKYHLIHHRHQGEDNVDMDIPTEFEAKFFNTSILKAIWLTLQPFFYSIRPLVKMPLPMNIYEISNVVVQLIFDLCIVQIFGWRCAAYLVLSTFITMGVHPLAGHFISEHYMVNKKYETYSYYGILNLFTFNVGYHNEHHDFPSIPGSRLPLVRKMAPEFYDDRPHHSSWVKVLIDFVLDPEMALFSRTKRQPKL